MSTNRFDLFTHVLDRHLLRTPLPEFRGPHLYPSEASVIDRTGKVHGRCLRAIYYRLTDTPPSDPLNARAMWIFELGKAVETMIINLCKEAGIWVADHVKWQDPEYNLHGEIDLIIRHPLSTAGIWSASPEILTGVEIKSFYSYQAACEIMGTNTSPGFPKIDQLLQTLIYAYQYRDILQNFKMVYMDRGGAARREFDVWFQEVTDTAGEKLIYPVVDGRLYEKFTLQDVLQRYKTVQAYFDRRELPPRDFKPFYTIEDMENLIAKGEIAKTNAEGFKRQPQNPKFRKADWQCHYCQYMQACWPATEIQQLLGIKG